MGKIGLLALALLVSNVWADTYVCKGQFCSRGEAILTINRDGGNDDTHVCKGQFCSRSEAVWTISGGKVSATRIASILYANGMLDISNNRSISTSKNKSNSGTRHREKSWAELGREVNELGLEVKKWIEANEPAARREQQQMAKKIVFFDEYKRLLAKVSKIDPEPRGKEGKKTCSGKKISVSDLGFDLVEIYKLSNDYLKYLISQCWIMEENGFAHIIDPSDCKKVTDYISEKEKKAFLKKYDSDGDGFCIGDYEMQLMSNLCDGDDLCPKTPGKYDGCTLNQKIRMDNDADRDGFCDDDEIYQKHSELFEGLDLCPGLSGTSPDGCTEEVRVMRKEEAKETIELQIRQLFDCDADGFCSEEFDKWGGCAEYAAASGIKENVSFKNYTYFNPFLSKAETKAAIAEAKEMVCTEGYVDWCPYSRGNAMGCERNSGGKNYDNSRQNNGNGLFVNGKKVKFKKVKFW